MGSTGQHLVSVELVTDSTRMRHFIALPRAIYADDPNWIAPLDFETRQRLGSHNPFFEHARMQLWLAYRNGKPVGRISAQIDELCQSGDQKIGHFGMLEGEDDAEVFASLLAAAEGWLREQGMTCVRGPMNLSINQEVGLLVDGFERPPFIMMGHNHPYYGPRIEASSYQKAVDTFTYMISPTFETPAVMQRLAEKAAHKVTVRCLRRKHMQQDFEILRNIFNDAWQDNWGFVPYTQAEFTDMGKTLALVLDDGYVQIAEIDGRPVAFAVALPNINEAARDLKGRLLPFGWAKLLWRLKVRHPRSARVPLLGVRKEFHHSRLGPTLAFMVTDGVRKALAARKVEKVELGWILEDNDGMRSVTEAIGGQIYKRYRIYQKQL